LETSKVLVTGGTGFIGRQVVPLLCDRGDEVHVVTSRRGTRVDDRANLHVVDLFDRPAREALVATLSPDRLVHLAWYLEPGQVWSSLENVRWVEATLGLLRAFAVAGGSRAVLAGSFSEYGPRASRSIEESAPLLPSNLYGVCKSALGQIAQASAEPWGIDVAWARIFSAYGPGEHPKRLVASVVRNLLAGREAPCSHGRQVRDYLSTMDIASALVAILDSEVVGPVNVGSGTGVTLRDLVETTAGIVGRPDLLRFGEVVPPPDDPPCLVADVGRLRDEVGWSPQFDLAAGLEHTVTWFRQVDRG
jgi:nucleoside-diphosphate-sugar epimerase